MLRCLSIMILCGFLSLSTAEEKSDRALVTLELNDAEQLRQRLASSVYATIWQHDALKELRGMFAEMSKKNEAKGEASPHLLYKNLKSGMFVLDDLGQVQGGRPTVFAQIDIGTYAQSVWNMLKKEGKIIDGGDEKNKSTAILQLEDNLRAALFENSISWASDGRPLTLRTYNENDADFSALVLMDRLYGKLADIAPADEAEMLRIQQRLFVSPMQWNARFHEAGVTEQCVLKLAYPLTSKTDRSLLDFLPAGTLAVSLMSTNVADNNRAIKLMGGEDSVNRIPRMYQQMLESVGIKNYSELLRGLDGTSMFALVSGAPFPGVVIVLPRTAMIDGLVKQGLLAMGVAAPQEGTAAMLPLPMQVPVMVQFGYNASYWVISSDMGSMQRILSATGKGGFSGSTLDNVIKKLPLTETSSFFVYDMPSILTTGAQYAAMIPDPELRMQIASLLQEVAGKVKPGYISLTERDEVLYLEGDGLFGMAITPVVPGLLATMLLPAVTGAQESAHKAVTANNLKEILKTMILHRAKTRQTWPNPWSTAGVDFPKVTNAEEGMLVTAAMFEYLAKVYDIPVDLFYASNFEGGIPDLKPRIAQEIVAEPNILWAQCFAFDWSAPKTSGSMRPVLCTRYPVHGDMLVVYVDSHLGRSDDFVVGEVVFQADKMRTQHTIDGQQQWSVVDESKDVQDDIFSPKGDALEGNPRSPYSFARGNRKRAWMK